MLTKLFNLKRDEDGATAIEYGLIAAGIAVAIIAIVFTIGDEIENMFSDVQTQLENRDN
ncbi:Flp family type IVb pilin [Roseospirillum parvum]|uniref:Pilus assembly protein Flp/PilA n=1 Tax=Roseospirillum parvum TaxID=83401 RepID=A0A1G8BZU4_9PROT|nr:Flp family type IVb pilin [Roseospirillum parvum]SDH38583.1 pilus assembly protein Flp/PilA [Roseospirillum parvum]